MGVSPSTFVIDESVNSSSTNPVQNKGIYEYLNSNLPAGTDENLEKAVAAVFNGNVSFLENIGITVG